MLNFKLRSTFSTIDDNFVFQLLYRWTVIILVFVSLIITFKLWLGYSFSCTSRSAYEYGLSAYFLDCHCYAAGTFVVRSSWNKTPGVDIPYHGIEKPSHGDIRSYLTYYGWVNLLLLIHAFNFYLPRLIWKMYERDFLQKLLIDNDVSEEVDDRNLSLDVLAKYIVQSHGKHFIYPVIHILCEILNHIVAICQTVWLVHFFGVTGVPKEAPEVNLETWGDFATFYFPLKSKCTLYLFGQSGDVQKHDALCNLPLNNGYWFLFLFLYAWYNLLAVLTGLNLVYRLSLCIPRLRLQVLKLKAPLTHVSHLHSICGRSSYSDWFVLSRVQVNLRDDRFADLIARIMTLSQDSEKTDVFEVSEKEP